MEAEVTVARVRTTDRLGEIYAAHGPRAGRLAYLLTSDRDLAQDLAQEAFARLIPRLPALRSPDAIQSYLRRSVVNLARSHWRRRSRERVYVLREGPVVGARTQPPPDLEERDALWTALTTLPYRQRAALVLRFYEDLTERQTADALGCAVGTAKSLVSRGLTALRQEMRGEEVD